MPTNQEPTAHVGDWIEHAECTAVRVTLRHDRRAGENAGIPQLHISPLCRRGHRPGVIDSRRASRPQRI